MKPYHTPVLRELTVKIVDEDLLAEVRRTRVCEWCSRPAEPNIYLEPHHLLARGFGGGSRLDVALNLIAVHRLPCHSEAQVDRDRCLQIVAAREGYESGEDVLIELYRLLREPKR